MKAFKHVFNTWVLAHLVHPFVFYLYFSLLFKDYLEFEALLSLFIGALIISLPSLIFGFLFIRFVLWLHISTAGSFLSWLMLALSGIFLNIILLGLLIGENLTDHSDKEYFVPSFIATIISLFLRVKTFHILVSENNRYEERDDIISSYD